MLPSKQVHLMVPIGPNARTRHQTVFEPYGRVDVNESKTLTVESLYIMCTVVI